MLDPLKFTFYSYVVRTQWGSKKMLEGISLRERRRQLRRHARLPKIGFGDMSRHIRLVEITELCSGLVTKRMASYSTGVYLFLNQGYTVAGNWRRWGKWLGR